MDSISFQSIVPFESKYKRPTKNKTKSLLQQSTILNDTDILSNEDETNHSQVIKDQNTTTLKEQTLALQYPTKSDYCNQQVPFFDPSFFRYKKILSLFLPPRRYPNNNRNFRITTKSQSRSTKNFSWATK